MKKTLSLILALLLCLSLLVGCGSSTGTTTASTDSTASETTDSADTADTADAADTADSAEYPEMTLKVSVSYSETETAGQVIAYFLNYITENSGGNIQFDVYWGATFCSSSEDLIYVQNGSVDMTMLSVSEYTDYLPLSNFPNWAGGSQENVVNYFEYIMFENETTSALIEEELTEQNIKILGVNAGGANAFAAKFEITSYEDLAGHTMAFLTNESTFNALGITCSFSVPPDTYTNLQKGVVDCAAMALSGMVSMSWYEVAPYIILDGMYACSNFYTINLDVWNSFDEATQALFEEAAEAGKANSFVLYEDELEASIATIDEYNAEQGIDFVVITQDDAHIETMLSEFFANAAEDSRTSAANAGKSEEMEIILAAASEFLGVEF